MNRYIDRTCTVVTDDEGGADQPLSRPLSDFRDHAAYVLLGAPGAGKTEAFKHEAGSQGFCDARDFKTLGYERWSNVTALFIDGLDEMRAGSADGRTALDEIRGQLDRLGQPRFRLSCREADWFGAADRKRLELVSPDGDVQVLRLDPLSEHDIREVLDGQGVADIDDFTEGARDRGLGSLLSNPQTLRFLAAAVAGGNWPATRTDTIEAALRILLRELNEGHFHAVPQRTDSELLHTAGYLCAIQLLTGRTGHRLPMTADDSDSYIDLRDIPEPSQEALLATLHTKVFDVTDGLATPTHRHIAEFLTGRYLSHLIENGLPTGRVLALLTGEDGRTISALRGLAAWFAAYCKAARKEIIERDPLGTVLYGDVRSFSVADKRFLLRCLEQDAERDPRVFGAMHDMDSRWEDLATTDMEDTFREVLTGAEASQGKQTLALAVVRSLERDAVIPGVAPMLLDVVRDGRCWPAVRNAALEACVRQSCNHDEAQGNLMALLADVYQGTVPDPLDDLLGLLLKRLYPGMLAPAEVGRYLRERKSAVFAQYAAFWNYDIVTQSTDSNQLADVLDSLVGNFEHVGKIHNGAPVSYWLRTIPAKLLDAYLKASSTVDDERLFVWLGLAAKEASRDARASIRAWLSDHPSSYEAVVRLAADRCSDLSDLRHEVYMRLFSAVEPPDFGAWCLGQAAETGANTEAATEFFLDYVIARQGDEGISREAVEDRLAHDPILVAKYRSLRESRERSISNFKLEQSKSEQRRETDAMQHRREWRDLVKDHEPALRENRAAVAILHRLASAYLGWFVDVQGADGRSRLQDLLGNDGLVDMVIEAFRASATRSDLPDMPEIFRLAGDQKYHFLMLPVLVGLNEHSSLRPGRAPLDEQGMRRALAFRFNAPDFWNQEPLWYRAVLRSRPDLVADVLIRSVRANLRQGASSSLGLDELGHDNDYQPVAEIAVKPLLKSFPTRHQIEQLHVLKVLLHVALRLINDHELLGIVEGKLTLRSMDAAQQMYWICAGLLLRPALFADRLRRKLAGRGHERRVRHVAELLYNCDVSSIEALDVAALELLVESLGKSYRPVGWRGSGKGENVARGNPDYTGLIVDSLINAMSSKPSHDATEALERLSEDTTLRPWRVKLQDATSRQQEVRREANFRHPTVQQVLGTLANRHPTNAADLAALALDVLDDLARNIRHGNTSDWRQYWNRDRNERLQPMPENDCRDRLLSDLKAKLAPLNVDAQPEGTYADDKRADIRVSCDGFNVPIEIKKSTHDDLWRAIRNQLIAKYTRDPGTDGYGIYLVFWFGRDRCKRPPSGPVPETPDALRDQLLARADLSPEEHRKISVCVIDVSKPEPQSGSMPA